MNTLQTSPIIAWLALLLSALVPAQTAKASEAAIDDTPKLRHVEHPAWFKQSFLDLGDDLEEAAEVGKTGIAVYFGQEHCAYCEAQMAINFGRETDIVSYTRQHFDVIALDIWGSRTVTDLAGRHMTESRLAEAEGTNFTPSFIFYDSRGRQALRLRGYYPPYRFRAALQYVANGYYRSESFRDYLARADPPPKFDLADMNEQPFFAKPPFALDRSRIPAQRPLAVFFEHRDCHACDILHSGPLQDPETRALLDRFEVVQLDMRADTPVLTPRGERLRAHEWARSLGLFYAPSLLFFDHHGHERIRVDSVIGLYRLQGVLEYVLDRGYETAPTYQRWRAQRMQSRD